MQPRLNYAKAAPEIVRALMNIEKYLKQCGLESRLLLLVALRASILNGCTRCVHMHTGELIHDGMAPEEAALTAAWSEAEIFSERERAALAWTDAVTNVQDGHVPDEVFEQVRPQFDEKELADLTLAVTNINCWNRLNVAFRIPVSKDTEARVPVLL